VREYPPLTRTCGLWFLGGEVLAEAVEVAEGGLPPVLQFARHVGVEGGRRWDRNEPPSLVVQHTLTRRDFWYVYPDGQRREDMAYVEGGDEEVERIARGANAAFGLAALAEWLRRR